MIGQFTPLSSNIDEEREKLLNEVMDRRDDEYQNMSRDQMERIMKIVIN